MTKFKELQPNQIRQVGDGVRAASLLNVTGASGHVSCFHMGMVIMHNNTIRAVHNDWTNGGTKTRSDINSVTWMAKQSAHHLSLSVNSQSVR